MTIDQLQKKHPTIWDALEKIFSTRGNGRKYRSATNALKTGQGISFDRILEILQENGYGVKIRIYEKGARNKEPKQQEEQTA